MSDELEQIRRRRAAMAHAFADGLRSGQLAEDRDQWRRDRLNDHAMGHHRWGRCSDCPACHIALGAIP